MDIGGDDRGAYSMGRYAPFIREENDFQMAFVANPYRPLTRTPEEALEVMREIEAAGGLPFTAIVNNANLAHETTADHVLASVDYMAELSRLSGLPVWMTTAEETVAEGLKGKVENLLPMSLQARAEGASQGPSSVRLSIGAAPGRAANPIQAKSAIYLAAIKEEPPWRK